MRKKKMTLREKLLLAKIVRYLPKQVTLMGVSRKVVIDRGHVYLGNYTVFDGANNFEAVSKAMRFLINAGAIVVPDEILKEISI